MPDMMSMDLDAITTEQEAHLWRENAAQLASALRIAKAQLEDSGMHVLISPQGGSELTSGQVIIGALAAHDWAKQNIPPPF